MSGNRELVAYLVLGLGIYGSRNPREYSAFKREPQADIASACAEGIRRLDFFRAPGYRGWVRLRDGLRSELEQAQFLLCRAPVQTMESYIEFAQPLKAAVNN